MLGDDASMAFMELIKRILDILKAVTDGNRGPVKSGEPKKPKIKIGKLSKKDFTKLRDSGTNFGYVTIPKEKLPKCNHKTCELRMKHPPNGEEFALGCSVCRNNEENFKDY